jgi:hypothetical protein
VLSDYQYVLSVKQSLNKVIRDLEGKTTVKQERLYNLENSSLPILQLAEALSKNTNYKGLILNMINEVDTTNFYTK